MNSHLGAGKLFGARACILIQFDGTIDELAARLAEALNLKSFEVDVDEYPPHNRIGMAEALGWEAWLEEESVGSSRRFRLSMSTEVSGKLFDEMHNLSPWFACLIATMCDVATQPVPSSDWR